MNEHIQQFSPIAGGCFRDASTMNKTEGGQWLFMEFTPILNPVSESPFADIYGFASIFDIRDWQGANALATGSALAGGGWRLPSVVEEVSLRDYDAWAPACKVPDSPVGGFVISRTRAAAPANYGPIVLFVSGGFPNADGSTKGLARGVRYVSTADATPVAHDRQPQIVPIGDSCFRDAATMYKNQSGQWCFLECTPVFGPLEDLTKDEAFAVVTGSTLAGGGWRVSAVKEEVSLRTYFPLSGVPGDPDAFLTTRSSPMGANIWGISLDSGEAGITAKSQDRFFLRGSRLTVAV